MERTAIGLPLATVREDILPPGTVLGRHRIDGRLSEGGMAILYHGSHVETAAQVAVKVMRGALIHDPELQGRFTREAAVMGRLVGVSNIVQIHDVGALPDGRRYLVMEFIRGTDLATELHDLSAADTPMDFTRACRIARDVAAGVRDAHARRVVHRDLKPSNVMLKQESDGLERAKIVDFGVSADLDALGRDETLTVAGAAVGTVGYMAPEQAFGVAASPSFDIYALGVLLFEMLTGVRPPSGDGQPIAIPRVSELRPGVPPSLEAIVAQCLAFDAAKRPRSAGEVVERLDKLMRGMSRELKVMKSWAGERPDAVAGAFVTGTPSKPHPVARGGDSAATVPGTTTQMPRPTWHRWGSAGAVLFATIATVALWSAWPPIRETPDVTAAALATDVGWPSAAPDAAADPLPLAKSAVAQLEAPPASADAPSPGEEIEPDSQPAAVAPAEPDIATPEPEVDVTPDEPDEPPTVIRRAPKPAASPAVKPIDKPTATSAPQPDERACEQQRLHAKQAKAARQWERVLLMTNEMACWADSVARLRLRVQALLELGRYDRCVATGAIATDPSIARVVAVCRKHLEKRP